MMDLNSIIRKCILLTLACCSISCSQEDANSYSGYVEAKLTYLSNPQGGKLEKLLVSRGEKVAAAQMLFVLDPYPELLDRDNVKFAIEESIAHLDNLGTGMRATEIAAIKAQVEQVTKELSFFKQETHRYKQLLSSQSISRQRYEEAVKNQDTTKARLDRLQAELKTAELPARPDLIKAAFAKVEALKANAAKIDWVLLQKNQVALEAGIIYDTYYSVGEQVPPGRPIVSLMSPKNINVIFYVPENALSQLALNQSLSIHCDRCKTPLKAHIRYISQVAEYTPPVIFHEKTRDNLVYRVEAGLPFETTTLLPGQPVNIHIER